MWSVFGGEWLVSVCGRVAIDDDTHIDNCLETHNCPLCGRHHTVKGKVKLGRLNILAVT